MDLGAFARFGGPVDFLGVERLVLVVASVVVHLGDYVGSHGASDGFSCCGRWACGGVAMVPVAGKVKATTAARV